jgi:hypothetical protein
MAENDFGAPFVASLPTRIIGYAWGDSYVDELLNLALPALLAPGNLPAVAAQVQCELVLVSEERLFAKIAGHPAIKKAQELCAVRLVGLDDLITRSDKYGMALTYALHRAFADLGPAMTDAWLMFFNADFILADGSLRNLLGHLMRGERIVASPSYCAAKEDLLPKLKSRLAADPTRLAIAPRQMAELILQYRHKTIRGKTINQSRFHLLQADQFYWEVDHNTLVGQQMPVAIVGMRPQRYVPEPNAFWDHGLMLELCPDAEAKLLGDSDEFLMLELRGRGVAQEQIITGPADPRDLAERMITWVTPYQASFAHRPLVLHAAGIPAEADAAHEQLDAFVSKVLSYAPAFPSHISHPQWDYHWPDFMKLRHAFLSTRLGARTEVEPPPASMLEIDKLWWRLDSAEKSRARAMQLLTKTLEKIERDLTEIDHEMAACAATALDNIAVSDLVSRSISGGVFTTTALEPDANDAQDSRFYPVIVNADQSKLALKRKEAEIRKVKVQYAIAAAQEQYLLGENEYQRLRYRYEALLRTRVKSAGIPIIRWRAGDELGPDVPLETEPLASGGLLSDAPWFQVLWRSSQESLPRAQKRSHEAWLRRMARKVDYRVFGRWPRLSKLNPFWACAQPLLAAIEAAKAGGARDALIVVDAPGAFPGLATLLGKIAHVSVAGLDAELFVKALERRPHFDLCVLHLKPDDIPRLSDLLATLEPYMQPGGTIIGFYMNIGQPVGSLTLDGRDCKVAFTGSAASLRAIRFYSAAFRRICGRRLLGVARGLAMLVLSVPLVLWANLVEAAAARKGRLPDPAFRTSVTIIVHQA